MKRAVFLVLFAAAAVTASSLAADHVFHETSDVSLVEVPVNVVGRDGLPVRGLTAADFEIEDEGHPQEITALDVVDLKHNKLASDLPDALPEAARRHFLFLFDFSFATPNEIVHSRRAALQFVEQEMAPEDRAAVATTTVEAGPRLLVNFTADRKQLVAAIRLLGLPKTGDHDRDPLAFAFLMPGDPHTAELVTPGGEAGEQGFKVGLDSEVIATLKLYANMAQKTSDEFAVTRVSRHLEEMGSLATALDAVEGTKRIVYFSEGFDSRLIFGNLSRTPVGTTADNDAMARGGFWALDVDKRYVNSPLERQIHDTMDLFRRSDCIVYAVDIARLRTDSDATMGQPAEGKESLYLFAHETGGELIQNGNDLVGALHRINEKTSVTYVLSFRPSLRLGEGKFHRLKVRTRRNGSRVSARAGYYEARAFHALTPLERSLAAADVINGGRPKGDIPIRALAIPFADSGIARVPIVIQIPGDQLAGPANPARLRLGLYVYVTDEQGSLADYFSRSVSFDLARQGNRLSSGDFRYYAICRLLPGRYQLRAYVRDEESGRYGFTTSAIEIPDFGGTKLKTLPPLFVSDGGRGVSMRDSSPPSTPDAGDPFEVGGVSFVPLVDPAIAAGSGARVCLMLYREGATSATPFAIEAQILDASGRPRGPARVSLIGQSSSGAEGLLKVLLDFSAGNLPPGNYALRVTIRDSQEGHPESSSEAPFTIS